MEFLVHGALSYNDPGVFVSFEESASELDHNFASLGFDLPDLASRHLISIDAVLFDSSEIRETGPYDLEGLFIRLGEAIDQLGAKRVVLDAIDTLFSGLSNTAVLRAELRRLFLWLKHKGVTSIVTCERGEGAISRHGLEEYIADCVIFLDLRIREQVATRRLRIIKYRGSRHGTDEYPFLIDEQGISIRPVSALGLQYAVSSERMSSGIPQLDAMLGGLGYFQGSSILISGTTGSGKSSVAVAFVDAACRRGERCLYVAFEESEQQIIRNMRSIGIDLAPWVEQGLLRFYATRTALHGLEMHLLKIDALVKEFAPRSVVVDPISNFTAVGSGNEARSMLTRLIDSLKHGQITAVLTDLIHSGNPPYATNQQISSLIDSWLSLQDFEHQSERNRVLQILKSRGMAHSNQLREFILDGHGIKLIDVCVAPTGVVIGTARVEQEAQGKARRLSAQRAVQRKLREHKRQREQMEANITAMRAEFDDTTAELTALSDEAIAIEHALMASREASVHGRQFDAAPIVTSGIADATSTGAKSVTGSDP
ncbi:circadian clock protein KaiC [Actimicrobium antarcticum]|uniref:Circadian clock protein KaiC n=2 Tax=Actimicrobium antarcticum TaxID=1051899 RepID=A0ABP7TZ34_9BURK